MKIAWAMKRYEKRWMPIFSIKKHKKCENLREELISCFPGPGPWNCCWPSPAQPFLVSNPVGTHGQIFIPSKVVNVFGNGVTSSTRGGVGLSEYAARLLHSKVKVKVTLRPTVSQSVSLGVEAHLGLMTRYLLLFDNYGPVFVGRSLWREDGSVWASPA
jgi:hypothetical protein